jgi:hypothetical protein
MCSRAFFLVSIELISILAYNGVVGWFNKNIWRREWSIPKHYRSKQRKAKVKAYDISFILRRALAHLALIAFFAVSRRFSGLGVTRTGNTHLRRVATEAAWAQGRRNSAGMDPWRGTPGRFFRRNRDWAIT